ncbi:MAG TPA: hypothetical protein VH950_16025 [Gaiellaceae bacterium]
MPWNQKRREFRLVARKDVQRLTGLTPEELLRAGDTQELTSVNGHGVRVELVRVPADLLLDHTTPSPDV